MLRCWLHGGVRLGRFRQQVIDDRLVERRLLSGQHAAFDHLDLVRQVVDDGSIRLQAAQHERPGDPAEQGGRLVVSVSFDGAAEALAERPRAAEQTGVEDLHDRPQLGQPILDRGAGQRHPAGRGNRPNRPGLSGAGVLDLVGLVEHKPTPADLGERVAVQADERVRGEHHIVRGGPFDEGRLVRKKPRRAVVNHDLERRGEPIELALPIPKHRDRTHDQRRTVGRVGENTGDELCRLAQPHVVGQAGAEPQPAQKRQPAHTACLIGAQLADEPCKVRDRGDRAVRRFVEKPAQPARRRRSGQQLAAMGSGAAALTTARHPSR